MDTLALEKTSHAELSRSFLAATDFVGSVRATGSTHGSAWCDDVGKCTGLCFFGDQEETKQTESC